MARETKNLRVGTVRAMALSEPQGQRIVIYDNSWRRQVGWVTEVIFLKDGRVRVLAERSTRKGIDTYSYVYPGGASPVEAWIEEEKK